MAWPSKPPTGIQLNRNHPLVQGLVGCWLFNEGSGLRANDLCGMNHGTLTSFEPFSSTSKWSGGNTGTVLMFDGTNDVVVCGNNPSLDFGTRPFSIEFWIDGKTPSTTFVGFVGKPNAVDWTATSAKLGFLILERFADDIRIEFGDGSVSGSTGQDVTTLGSYRNQGWLQFVVTVGTVGDTIKAYKNTTLSNQVTRTVGSITNTINLSIGAWTGIVNRFSLATYSIVRIWNRSLNQDEVKYLYNKPYEMFWNPSERIRKNYDNELLI